MDDHTTLDTQVIEIPLNQLHDSPFNPRKTYDDKGLQELADTMRPPHGRVLQPVVVRVMPRSPRPLLDGVDTFTDYELVFGHRRKRGAQLAGLATVPAIVRTMTDEEVQRAQIIENLARADVHAIEEAEGFAALMKDHGVTADQLVADTGKSRSYIYGRLKLLQAIPEVREACLRGEFGSETALLIARIGDAKLQQKALKALAAKYISLTDGGTKSYRQARELLARMFTLDLAGAIFDTASAELLPRAGACNWCPKLSGHAPEFEDIGQVGMQNSWGQPTKPEPKRCTDPTCWDAKHAAHLQAQAAELRGQGKTVVDGAKARQALSAYGEVKGAYVALDAKLKAALKKANKTTDVTKAEVLIQDPRTGKTVAAVPRAVLGMEAAVSGAKASSNAQARKAVDYEEQRREREARRASLDAAQATVLAHLRNQPRTLFDLRMIASALADGFASWQLPAKLGYADMGAMVQAVETMSADELGLFLITLVLDDDGTDSEGDELRTVRFIKHYDIQGTGLLSDSTAADTPTAQEASDATAAATETATA
jgi:ParB/RepB/Spo0J family partition protein